MAVPVVKWPGGKRQMLDVLVERMPLHYNRFIEPFFGGGALFFRLEPGKALISDVNPELINLYEQVRDYPDAVLKELSQMRNTKEFFLKVRALSSDGFGGVSGLTKAQRAARVIFLTKTAFNGLYRTNKQGEFNSPYGYYKSEFRPDESSIYSASHALRKAQIVQGGFRSVLLNRARRGNFVFLDPPYMPISKTSSFVSYSKDGFGEEEQVELADVCKKLDDRGVKWMQTNSDADLIGELYAEYNVERIAVKRSINANGGGRKGFDLVIRNY